MSPRLRLGLLVGAGVVVLAAAAVLRPRSEAAAETVEPRPDWWSLDLRRLAEQGATDPLAAENRAAEDRAAAERARELSLPYARAGRRLPAAGGARALVPARVAPGANLYVSAHGPEAMLVDREGRRLWRWRYPFERAFPDLPPTEETPFWRRARLLPDGDLLVLVQGAGVFRLDRRSRLLWASRVPAYNDLVPLPDGGVLTLTKEARHIPRLGAGGPVLEDFLVELDERGRVRRRVSILRALLASPWASWLLEREQDDPDLLHGNAVVPLDGRDAEAVPAFAAGNVLLSLREIDALVVMDPRSGALLWALRGSWRRQHDPVPLPGGEIALFDNKGRGGHSRLLRIDARTGAAVGEFPPPAEPPLRSEQAGAVHLLPNGNLLVVESQSGRAFELGPDGQVVWEMGSPHRMGARGQFVAYLFDVQRVTGLDWLEGDRR